MLIIMLTILLTSFPIYAQEEWPYNPLFADYTLEQSSVVGNKTLYLVPEHPRALLILFHGAGGHAEYWFHYSDQARFILDMYNEGYVIAAPESNDRRNKRWSFKARHNEDIKTVDELVKRFKRKYSNDFPVFGAGMSNGGSFAPIAAYNLNFRAIAIYCSVGHRVFFEKEDFRIPVIMNVGVNDRYFKVANARERLDPVKSRNIPCRLNIKRPEPVTLDMFRNIGGVSEEDAKRLYSIFTDNYFLDKGGHYPVKEFGMDWKRFLPDDLAHLEKEIWSLLWLTYAGHVFMDDYNQNVIDFFEEFIMLPRLIRN